MSKDAIKIASYICTGLIEIPIMCKSAVGLIVMVLLSPILGTIIALWIDCRRSKPNSEQKVGTSRKVSEQITTSFTDEDEEVITRVKTIMGGV